MRYADVTDLPRNDLEACELFYAERGSVTADDLRMMLKLHDDPAPLMKIIDAKKWIVTKS